MHNDPRLRLQIAASNIQALPFPFGPSAPFPLPHALTGRRAPNIIHEGRNSNLWEGVFMRNSKCRPATRLVFVLLFLTVGAAGAWPQAAAQSEKLIEIADQLIPEVVRIRGLQPKGPIEKGIKSRAEIAQFIAQEVDRQYEKSQLRAEGILLQKLGLIPADMDYVAFTLKLLSEQVGGYYVPEKKAFYIAGWLPVDEQKPAMVHELTHALQDQHFDLNGMMERDRKAHNGDRTMAHQAIAEGDATAVMLDYLLQPAGKSFLDLPDLVSFMSVQMALMNEQFAVLKMAPAILKETLLFPYSYGTTFLQQVRSNGQSWAAVNRIYGDMPSSTEQIMHPEKYAGARDNPRQVEIADPSSRLGKDWKVHDRSVLGEFFLYQLLKSQLPDDVARKASAGWGGDQVVLVGDEGAKSYAAFVETVWDNPESAERFYAAMSSWMEKKYPQGRKAGESESGFGVISAGEFSSIRRSGSSVRIIVGLPETLADKVDPRLWR